MVTARAKHFDCDVIVSSTESKEITGDIGTRGLNVPAFADRVTHIFGIMLKHTSHAILTRKRKK